MNCFSVYFKILSTLWFYYVYTWISLSLSFLEFDEIHSYIDNEFHQIFGRPLFLQRLLLTFLLFSRLSCGTPIIYIYIYMLSHLVVSLKSLKLCSFFYILFLLFLDWIISINLFLIYFLILSPAYSYLLLTNSTEFLIFLYLFKNFYLGLIIVSITLLIISVYDTFSYFPVVL